MVHDPRVTSALARLGGVYRDPSRVDRDAASLLKSSVGMNLIPIAAEMVENNGTSSTVLVLQGTIAIHFRGNTYQLLTDIYLPSGYPIRPPIPYVRLANSNMYLKENHRHVGSDGKIYLPYLHEWKPTSHNLIELVVAMSSVFSADPPVFTRTTNTTSSSGSSGSSGTSPMTSHTSTTSFDPTPPPPLSAASLLSSPNTLSQMESMLAREAAEANAAAAAARRAQEDEDKQRLLLLQQEQRRQDALQAQKQWEQSRTAAARQEVALKISKYCNEQSRKCQEQVQNDWRDQQRLVTAKEKIELQLQTYQTQKEQLEKQTTAVKQAQEEIQEWLQQHNNDNNTSNKNQEIGNISINNIDDCVIPSTKIQAQMMDLSAENAAIADALYFLDKALYQGLLDCSTHLKQVRRLAKRQFLVRAHLIKIQQVLLNNNNNTTLRSC